MGSMQALSSTLTLVILIGIISICEAWGGYPSYYGYRPYSYRKYGVNPFPYKRGPSLDRLSMGFVKRSHEMQQPSDNDENLKETIEDILNAMSDMENDNSYYPQYPKRYIDRLSSGFVRKKRDIDPMKDTHSGESGGQSNNYDMTNVRTVLNPTEHEHLSISDTDKEMKSDSLKSETATDKRALDRMSSGFVKKADIEDDKRGLDRLNSGFVKRPLDRMSSGFVKRPLDRMSSGFVKRPLDRMSSGFVKRPLDRMSSGFVKRPLDRMSSGFVKRPLDRMSSGFVKRPLDRMSSGFVKRPLDRMSSGFVKRPLDRMSSGFVKRPLDRMSSGFVKKDIYDHAYDSVENIDSDKRRMDRLSSGFVKKSQSKQETDNEAEKRALDRLTSGFVKKNDNEISEDKRRMDRLASGFVKKDTTIDDETDHEYEKRRLDRLNSGFVKKDLTGETDDELIEAAMPFGQNSEGVGYFEHPYSLTEEPSKRGLDRLSSSFVKRPFDRISSSFVKKSNSDNSDRLIDNELDKRYLDRMTMGFV